MILLSVLRIKNCDYGRPCLNFIADFHIDFELVRNGQIKFGSGAEFNHAVYFSPFDLFAWLDGAYDASGDSAGYLSDGHGKGILINGCGTCQCHSLIFPGAFGMACVEISSFAIDFIGDAPFSRSAVYMYVENGEEDAHSQRPALKRFHIKIHLFDIFNRAVGWGENQIDIFGDVPFW